ncbi:condensation domain-containing protein [Streptomyces fructofermentans]|uniref:condensation domain-containing protein n=1 Tax=Streptomyces fructofermentans TaxID=152141 RepID=UPI00379D2EE1
MTEEPLVVDTSFAQQSLWLQNEIDPGQSAYNVTAAVRLRGPLDIPVLERALNTVVERHEALRTVFDLDDGDPVQVIGPMPPLKVPVLDCRPEEFEETARAELEAPFDLRRGPLLRLRLLRLGEEHHVALLVMHHIVTDGVSSGILFQELTAAYEAHRAGRPPVLPELPIQYADFAAWQRDRLRGDELRGLTGHWSRVLAGAEPLRLPTDRPRPEVPTDRGGTHHFDLPAALVARLESTARRNNATPFMVLTAAFCALLSRYCGQHDITLTSPVSGRTRPELEGLIGYFVNPLLLRTDLSGDPDFTELLARVRTACLDAYKHQELPYEQAVDLLRQQGSGTQAHGAHVMLVLQARTPSRWEAAGLSFEMVHVDTGSSKADLILDVRPGDDGHHVVLQYGADLFDPATAERLAGHFRTVLESVTARPALPLSRVPLLSAEERHTLLTAWSTPSAEPVEGHVHTAVGAWAAKTPDTPAVVDAEGRLTYAELHERACSLAVRMREAGVRPGTVVALAAKPSAALAVAALAALKAGGCCLPLDPALPAGVLGALVEQSGAALVLDDTAPGPTVPDTVAPVTLRTAGGSAGADPAVSAGTALLNWTALGGGGHALAALAHGALLSAARDTAASTGLRPGTRWATTSSSPEQVLRQLVPVLTGGGTLVLDGAPGDERAGAAEARVDAALPESAGGVTVDGADRGPVPEALVLDGGLEPVPVGVTGELYLAGPALSHGYAGRPGLTATSFLPDPHGTRAGGRLFRTGERARRLADGTVERAGREDGLLTGGGLRVDPAETGRTLSAEPGVADCAVLVRALPGRRPAAVAYTVARPGEAPDPAGLLARLRDRLPAAWLPTAVVPVESIPRTAAGAPDQAALPLPDRGPEPEAAGYVAPRTPFEEEIARIWAELLGVERVGAYDNFFDLGGQSLTAVRLAARLREEFGADIAVRDLYADFTVAEVAWKVLQRLVAS